MTYCSVVWWMSAPSVVSSVQRSSAAKQDLEGALSLPLFY